MMITMTKLSYKKINRDNTAITVRLDKASKITLTDPYITTLEGTDYSYNNIDFNRYKLYIGGKAVNQSKKMAFFIYISCEVLLIMI